MRTKRWTVGDYHRMIEAGLLSKEDRVELLGGEIVEVSPIGGRHAHVVAKLDRRIQSLVEDRAVVWVQMPVRLSDDSEPEPDLTLLRWKDDLYPSIPTAADVLLVVEVADTSAATDRRHKLPRYAAAGITQVWLIDLSSGAVEDHRGPTPDGYLQVTTLRAGHRLAVAALEGIEVDVQYLLHPSSRP